MSTTKTEEQVVIGELLPGKRTIKKLDYNGYLFLEHDVPFLMIYRNIPEDHGTMRLARTGASYLIVGEKNFDYFNNIVKQVTEKMSKRFGAFIIIEIYSGHKESAAFTIRGPSHKLTVSLEVLKTELEKIQSRKYGGKWITAQIEQTKNRLNFGKKEFFSIEEIKNLGGTFIGLEIPPVYRNEEGELFPLYFRKFREGFTKALHKAVFEFIRVQAFSALKSYSALGKRQIDKELFKIDKELTAIENSYQFLLLVAPVNIQQVRHEFFESNFKNINTFHYRLLPIDPDLLKRKLYALRIDEIDDPALSFLYEEKREEIDQELSMLKERNSKNFFYRSLRLYQGVEKNVLNEAREILKNIAENPEQQEIKDLNAEEFSALAQEEFLYFRGQSEDYSGKVHIREDVNIMMVSEGELYIPADYTLTHKEAQALIQHEVGTHSLTYYNGKKQVLSQLSQGLAGYDALQEGLAVLAEYLCGGLTGNRLRTIAGRVIAGHALLKGGDFTQVFFSLTHDYGFSKKPAFNITSRIFQAGGFLKDIIYLRGLVHLKDFLHQGGKLEPLLSGKFALEHVDLIKDLTEREILIPPKILPRYMKTEAFQKGMEKLKNGISLSEMALPHQS